MRTTTLALLFSLSLPLAACGGGLKHVVDDNAIASATSEERYAINAVKDELTRADDEIRAAQQQEQATENELSLAENEEKAAKLQKSSSKVNRQAAEQSGDFNRKNKADREYTAAEKAEEAAEAKVAWLSKKKKWARATREAAEAHIAVLKSRIEVEKAKLCQQKGIRPSEKFNVMDFEQQSVEKQQAYNDARKDADEARTKVDDLERRYMTAKQHADASTANVAMPQ